MGKKGKIKVKDLMDRWKQVTTHVASRMEHEGKSKKDIDAYRQGRRDKLAKSIKEFRAVQAERKKIAAKARRKAAANALKPKRKVIRPKAP